MDPVASSTKVLPVWLKALMADGTVQKVSQNLSEIQQLDRKTDTHYIDGAKDHVTQTAAINLSTTLGSYLTTPG
jgi:hypothetical protein